MIREAYQAGQQKLAEDMSYLHGLGKAKEGTNSLLYARRYPREVAEKGWLVPAIAGLGALAGGVGGALTGHGALGAIGGGAGGLAGGLINRGIAKARLEEYKRENRK